MADPPCGATGADISCAAANVWPGHHRDKQQTGISKRPSHQHDVEFSINIVLIMALNSNTREHCILTSTTVY